MGAFAEHLKAGKRWSEKIFLKEMGTERGGGHC